MSQKTNHELIILALEQLRDGSYSPERRERCQVLMEEMTKMAYADYRHCDICDAKAFYDAELNYDMSNLDKHGNPKLERVGEMAVLCDECSKNYIITISKLDF